MCLRKRVKSTLREKKFRRTRRKLGFNFLAQGGGIADAFP